MSTGAIDQSTANKMAERGQTVLLLGAVALGALTWVCTALVRRVGQEASFRWPFGEADATESLGTFIAGNRGFTAATAWGLHDWKFVIFAALPAVLALIALLMPRKIRPVAAIIAGVATVALMFFPPLNAGSTWAFYIPAAALLLTAGVAPQVIASNPSERELSLLRFLGSLFIALPAFWLIIGMFGGVIQVNWQTITIAALSVLAAAGFAYGIRWDSLLFGLVGLAAMFVTLAWPGMMSLAFWVLGGVWFVVSLTGLVSSGHVRQPEYSI